MLNKKKTDKVAEQEETPQPTEQPTPQGGF